MKIIIDFEDAAVWEAADQNQIALDLLEQRLTRFCNSILVKKMLLEGTVLDPFPSKEEIN
tara:strand:+ start:141 stop:320 length:180 start_codon:yes stop_codon:yes gene_type:complete